MTDEISIRAPTRGATPPVKCSHLSIIISIRAPTRGATYNYHFPQPIPLFQSALPRGERHCSDWIYDEFIPISIRAPTRGATRIRIVPRLLNQFQSALPRGERLGIANGNGGNVFISIRAPTRGATVHINTKPLQTSYFNPRSHEGSDSAVFIVKGYHLIISIRAPTRGATNFSGNPLRYNRISIRAPTRGATWQVPLMENMG